MRRVTEKEFFDAIRDLNVSVTPQGNYPYRTDFCLKSGERERIGYIQDVDLVSIVVSEYYLCK